MSFRALTVASNVLRASQGLPPVEGFTDGSETIKNACATASKASNVGQQVIDTNLAATGTGDATTGEVEAAQATIRSATTQTSTASAAAISAAETAARKSAESTREILGQSQEDALAAAQAAAAEAQAAAAEAQEASTAVTGENKADAQNAATAATSAASAASLSAEAAGTSASRAIDKMADTAEGLLQQSSNNNEFFGAAATTLTTGGVASALQDQALTLVKSLTSRALSGLPGIIKIIALPAPPVIILPAIPSLISPIASLKDQVQPPPMVDRLTQRVGALGNRTRQQINEVTIIVDQSISSTVSMATNNVIRSSTEGVNASSISQSVSNAVSQVNGIVQCS